MKGLIKRLRFLTLFLTLTFFLLVILLFQKLNLTLINFNIDLKSNSLIFHILFSDKIVFFNCSHYLVILRIQVKDLVLIRLKSSDGKNRILDSIFSDGYSIEGILFEMFLIFLYLENCGRHNTCLNIFYKLIY